MMVQNNQKVMIKIMKLKKIWIIIHLKKKINQEKKKKEQMKIQNRTI